MNRSVEKLAAIITSLGAVIFVLLMTIIAMIFLSHGLYFQILSKTMISWQAEIASWVLACGIETTVLIVTCNTKFVSSRLPVFLAICSGIIVLFFIQAFDASQSMLDLTMRWFIGILVAALNYIYSELFYKKYSEALEENSVRDRMAELSIVFDQNLVKYLMTEKKLVDSLIEVERMQSYIVELENFRTAELTKVTCPHCKIIFESVYKLTSHKNNCSANKLTLNKEAIKYRA